MSDQDGYSSSDSSFSAPQNDPDQQQQQQQPVQKKYDVYAPIRLEKSAVKSQVAAKRDVVFNIPAPNANLEAKSFVQMVDSNFVLPAAYVRFRSDLRGQRAIEYELTVEDEAWLSKHPKLGLTESLMEAIINALEFATGFSAPVTGAQAYQVMEKFGVPASRQAVDEVCQYWQTKRNRLRKPLLRRFWPVTGSDDTNPLLTFRPREKERYKLRKKRVNDPESLEKMQTLREDFERVKDIVELVYRRERMFKLDADLMHAEYLERLAALNPAQPTPRPACLDVPLADLLEISIDASEAPDSLYRANTPPAYAGSSSYRRSIKRQRGGLASEATPQIRENIVAVESYEDDSAPSVPMYLLPQASPAEDQVELITHFPSNPLTWRLSSRYLRLPVRLVCKTRVGRLGRVMVDRCLESGLPLRLQRVETYVGPHPGLGSQQQLLPPYTMDLEELALERTPVLESKLARIYAEPDSEDEILESAVASKLMLQAKRALGMPDKFAVDL